MNSNNDPLHLTSNNGIAVCCYVCQDTGVVYMDSFCTNVNKIIHIQYRASLSAHSNTANTAVN